MAYQNKAALITGAASGLGRNLAETLHAQGATLIVADFNASAGETFVAQLNADRADSAFFQHVDVTKYDSQLSLFTAARSLSLVPRIDYIFVNAGISDDGMLLHPDNQPPRTFVPPNIAVLDVNLNGAVYSTTLAVQLLRDQEVVNGWRGKIVVTASLAGFHSIPCMPLYTASKHAMVGLVRALGPQLKPEHIAINAVAPDVVRTNIGTEEHFNKYYDEKQHKTTPIEAVTQGFLSFLADDNTDTGEIREVSYYGTVLRPDNETMPTSRAAKAGAPALEKIAYIRYANRQAPATK